MSKVKRVVLGKGLLFSNLYDDMVGVKVDTDMITSRELVTWDIIGKRGHLIFESIESKKKVMKYNGYKARKKK